jgi:uncharacterized membrane protein (UPF0127 family)
MIKNVNSKKIISTNEKIVTSVAGKAKGLIFCSKVERPLVFVFGSERIIDLHMLFVFCSIDVILLDRNKRVVEAKENFKPFTFFSSHAKAKYVIELAAGTVYTSKTKVGDMISF